jgi:cytochrome oxidase Cu insertion factor (SCO1/SenC/PrrC family)
MTAASGSPPTPRQYLPTKALAIICGFSVLAAAAFVLVALHGRADSQATSVIRPAGLPPALPTSIAGLMAIEPLTKLPAPNFSLSDQQGATVTMSGLKGKVVVLEFFDPHCTDVCPIISQELVDANNDLGSARSEVVFAAVNVNPYHRDVADMEAFSNEHSLNSIPSWRFLTGSVPALQSAWKAYGVTVDAPSPTADVVHSDYVYFIDRQGKLRYMADPSVDHRSNGDSYLPGDQLAAWGKGIALVTSSLVR